MAAGGSLTLNSVTLSNGLANAGQSGGGAVFSRGVLAVSGSTFSGNSAPSASGTSGGAINSSGALTVTGSSFTGNTGQEGGAIFNQSTTATATVTSSTFTGNQATIYGGGALLNADGSMTVTGDTFSGNSGPGGGVLDNDATVHISASTFTANTAGGNGGGAVQNFGTVTITQSTLSGNSSPFGADIYNYTGFTLSISTSIIGSGQQGSNCGGAAAITDAGYNLDTGTSCGFSAASHSLTSTNPQLGPLASNGGPTQTMALPAGSPAVDAIPASTAGCTGSTDQRGITRPQGSGCDIGAYELVVSSGGTGPSTPTGLAATQVTSDSVSLRWNAPTGGSGVTGYTVYRNGTTAGTTAGAGATTFTDVSMLPSTAYSYTVDAVDSSGNHSAQSAAVQVTTTAPSGIQADQGAAVATSSRVASTTITLSGPVHAGDLLAGWFGQYDAAGQVTVSDNVHGAWTRASASTTYSTGNGDIALYYLQNAAAAPAGITITISAASATFLAGAGGGYSGVATSGALDQTAVARGSSAAPDSGPTAATGAGDLVIGGVLTGGSPGTVTPGSSQGQPFTMRAQTSSGSASLADILSGSAGAQDARATFASATDWYAVAAAFRPYGSSGPPPDTQPPTTPTGLTATSVTASSAALSWNAATDNVGVAGYTVYRNGAKLATTGSGTTTYTDASLAPSTTYSYTVDAFDAAGNHSPPSAALQVTTPASAPPPAAWVQGGAVATGSAVTSVTVQLTSPVKAGDLLAGWFGQSNASGAVQVSDNVNGAWTRASASTTFSGGNGDIALFYVQNAAAAPNGLTITMTAASATYLQGVAADYTGVATSGALDQAVVARGSGTAASAGPTGSVSAGELVFSALMTGATPGGATAGSGLVIRSHTSTYSADDADADVAAAGPQTVAWQLQSSADWYEVAAVFHSAAGP